jgi:hypothetical protein
MKNKIQPHQSQTHPTSTSPTRHSHFTRARANIRSHQSSRRYDVHSFFVLLRPGEYTITNNNKPFRLQDTHHYICQRRIHPYQASPRDLNGITAVALCSTTKKNEVKGETISHSRRGGAHWYAPAKQSSDESTICYTTSSSSTFMHICGEFGIQYVSATDIRNTLRKSLVEIGPDTLGIQPHVDEAGGATALLWANIDPKSIQLLGQWKSDAMMRYLHIAVNPHTQQYAKQMFTNGQSSFTPGSGSHR